MDDATRMIIAYAGVISGLPLIVAKTIWFVPAIISSKIMPKIATRLDRVVGASIEGFLAILIACLVFDQLIFRITPAVPIILIIINALWEWTKEESLRVWPSSIAIIAGFFLYPSFLELLIKANGLQWVG